MLGKFTAGVLLLMMSASPDAAQSPPWSIVVTPTLNPLPIGFCGAVGLTMRDANGTDTPRNPLGVRLTVSDFDMTVTSPVRGAVAGQQIDPSHWSACACQGAVPGTVATVTASYPARSLPAAARLPGVAFQKTATFVLAAPKGATNPPACVTLSPGPTNSAAPTRPAVPAATPRPPVATAPVPSSSPAAPASARTPPANAPPSSSSASASSASSATAAPGAPASLPGAPSQMPSLPVGTAQWAALQQSLGSTGWAQMQKEIDAFMQQQQSPVDDPPPPGAPNLPGGGRNHAAAVASFKDMLPVLRHPRCANCHSDMTLVDQPAEDDMAPADGKDGPMVPRHTPSVPATHPGGGLESVPASAANGTGITLCRECHDKAPPAWRLGPTWPASDYELCQTMKSARFNGELFLEHAREDALIKLAFQGMKAMDHEVPEPPPLSHARFLRSAGDWLTYMDAMKKFPNVRSEGCPRTDTWDGAVEYTYTETGNRTKFESHGIVHIVGGLAKWSGLAARLEDHSAQGCASVYSASASGGGETTLVTMDHTSEKPLTGFTLNHPSPRQSAARQAAAAPNAGPTGTIMLTIQPARYGLVFELPLQGSGQETGGGPACPGYKPLSKAFDITINETGDGRFDPDHPDAITGTKTTTPFPGASMTLKWLFMRLNEAR